jgi:hypothetical protein
MDEKRLEGLERRIGELERELAAMKESEGSQAIGLSEASPGPARLNAQPAKSPPVEPHFKTEAPPAVPTRSSHGSAPSQSAPVPPPPPPRGLVEQPAVPVSRVTLEDVLSPRNLAIAGGIAVFVGLAFLVSLGISNGWIDETVRTIGAGIFSIALVAAGLYIQERRTPGTPAQALTVVGVAGLFLALVAATRLYALVDPVVALVLSAAIAVFGVLVGLRWRSDGVAAAIVGASLLSPLMVDASYSVGLLVFLVPLFAMASAACVVKPWPVTYVISSSLFLGSVVASLADTSGGSTIAAFALSGLILVLAGIGAVGYLLRNRDATEDTEPALYGIFVAVATLLGLALIAGSGSPDGGCLFTTDGDSSCAADFQTWAAAWSFFSAAFGGGVWWLAYQRGQKALAVTAFSLASAAIAAGLAFLFQDGPLLSAAWSVQAAGLIAFGQTAWQRKVGFTVLGLATAVVAIEVPPILLTDGSDELVRDLVTTAPLLLPFGVMAWRLAGAAQQFGAALWVTVAAYMGLLATGALIDPESVFNLVPMALAAALPIVFVHRDWSQVTFALFGSAMIIFTLLTAIPPDALIDGVPSALNAAIAGTILCATLLAVRLAGPRQWREPALWAALGLGLYVISALVIDAFQGTAGAEVGLPGVTQGQVIVSSLWALSGLGLIIAGLRQNRLNLRKAGLILLTLSMAKITLYDLASLNTAGRTISFILVGLVLLAAAFAYQWISRQESETT